MLRSDIDAMTDADARSAFDALCVERFGTHWKTDFADFAGITRRSVHVWMADTRPPVWAMQLMDADRRATDLARRMAALDQAIENIQQAKRNL